MLLGLLVHDVFISILTEWLELNSFVVLHSAVSCTHNRKEFLNLLSSEVFVHSGTAIIHGNNGEIIWWLYKHKVVVHRLNLLFQEDSFAIDLLYSYLIKTHFCQRLKWLDLNGGNSGRISVFMLKQILENCFELKHLSVKGYEMKFTSGCFFNSSGFKNLLTLHLSLAISCEMFAILFGGCVKLQTLILDLDCFDNTFNIII